MRRMVLVAVVVGALVAAVGIGVGRADAAGPVANAGGPYTGAVGQPITFNGSGSLGIYPSYTWTFSDGVVLVGVLAQRAFAHPGTYTATLTVTDITGLSSVSSTSVFIGGVTPVLSPHMSICAPTVGGAVVCNDPATVGSLAPNCLVTAVGTVACGNPTQVVAGSSACVVGVGGALVCSPTVATPNAYPFCGPGVPGRPLCPTTCAPFTTPYCRPVAFP